MKNRTRAMAGFAMAIVFMLVVSSSPVRSRGALQWPAWIPESYSGLGWVNPTNGSVAGRVPNLLFNPENGSANDTIMYSQLILNPSNDTLLVNYIDFENATGTTYSSNPFSLPVPSSLQPALDQEIAKYTTTQFEGTSIWDLIEFTFLEIWNARLSGIIVDVDMLTIGTHRSVLLDYGGSAGLGLVALVNAGNKVAIIFNVARNSSWMNVSTFTTNIQAYVSGFLSPLREILYVAHFDQETILASSSRPVPSSISTAQAGSYLDHTEFLNIVEAMMLDIPESSYPFILNWNQLVMIIVIILAIGLIIYYSLMSYKKEKTKIPETASRDEPLPYS